MILRLLFVGAVSMMAISCSSTQTTAQSTVTATAPVYQPVKQKPLKKGEDYSPKTELHIVGISGEEAEANGITVYRYQGPGKPSTVEWNEKSPHFPKVYELHKEAGY